MKSNLGSVQFFIDEARAKFGLDIKYLSSDYEDGVAKWVVLNGTEESREELRKHFINISPIHVAHEFHYTRSPRAKGHYLSTRALTVFAFGLGYLIGLNTW